MVNRVRGPQAVVDRVRIGDRQRIVRVELHGHAVTPPHTVSPGARSASCTTRWIAAGIQLLPAGATDLHFDGLDLRAIWTGPEHSLGLLEAYSQIDPSAQMIAHKVVAADGLHTQLTE